ncbi:MAG TPA: ABC transporter permease [Actinomycetota bacterium]|jgi:ABC-2 type transport system permease protein|nr:ABC transporter permease [Actinomycetota bacterium]
MIGTARMASASTKQLLRSNEVITTMVVFPAALLAILALYPNLRWQSPAGTVPLIDFWVTGMGVLAVALGNGHAFLATIANYKAGGVLTRLSVTPITPAQLILGEVIPRTVMGMLTIVAFFVVGRVLGAGIRLEPGILAVVPVMVMVTVTGLSVAFVIAGLTKSPQNANALDSSISFPLYLFTGAMFPLAAFPGWLETVARFIPYAGLITTVRGMVIEGRPLTDFGSELAIAAAWMVLLLLATARAYRFVK